MSRKIKAKTLAGLLSRYMRDFPSEVAGRAESAEPDEGAELLQLLPPEQAWALMNRLPHATAREWLMSCGDDALLRLAQYGDPSGKHDAGSERAEIEKRAVAALESTTHR